MKILQTELKPLMSKHIFELTKEQMESLAFILDIEISEFKKNDWQVKFKMTHKTSTVFVECQENSNISMGRSNKVKKGMSGLTSWGGQFSFANAVSTFRSFFCGGYELTMQSEEKLKVYEKDEWKEIVLLSNDLVEA